MKHDDEHEIDERDGEGGADGSDDSGVELSALVMLRPTPHDRSLGGHDTSNDLASALPDPTSVEALRATFMKLGFDVGPAVAISFSISGPDRLFDEVFPSAAPVLKSLESRSSVHDSSGEVFLSTDDLRVRDADDEGDARDHDSGRPEAGDDDNDKWADISAIFFPEAPDFGPGNP